jgi:hypothetical protein
MDVDEPTLVCGGWAHHSAVRGSRHVSAGALPTNNFRCNGVRLPVSSLAGRHLWSLRDAELLATSASLCFALHRSIVRSVRPPAVPCGRVNERSSHREPGKGWLVQSPDQACAPAACRPVVSYCYVRRRWRFGAYAPITKKEFKNVTKFWNKILGVHPKILCLYTSFRGKTKFYVACIKKIKKMSCT